MGENTVDIRGTVGTSSIPKSAMAKSKKADAKAAFERLTFARETLGNYEAMVNKTNNNDVEGKLLRVYEDFEINLKLMIALEQQNIMDGK